MKKIFFLLILMMSFVLPSMAETVVNDSTITTTLENTSKYVEIGHGIGVAVNETLGALESTVVDISETHIGKTAIFIVVWKLIGRDFVSLLFGITLFIFSMIILFKLFKLAKLTFEKGLDVDSDTFVTWMFELIGGVIIFVVLFVACTNYILGLRLDNNL